MDNYNVKELDSPQLPGLDFPDFADAEAWAHQLYQETDLSIGIWLTEGVETFLYALVYQGQTYVAYP